jgi:hypothetical protein
MTSETQKKPELEDRSIGTAYANQTDSGVVPKQAVNSALYTDHRATTNEAKSMAPAIRAATPSSFGKPG